MKPTYEDLLEALQNVVGDYDDTGCEECGVIPEDTYKEAERLVKQEKEARK